MRELESAIIISDVHLGRDVSYLDTRNEHYQENRNNFLQLLEEFRDVEEIIINGDLLETALVGWDIVVQQAKNFFALLAKVLKPQRVVYIPGNHDHHMWYSLAEKILVFEAVRNGENIPNKQKYPFCFIDKTFSSANPLHENYMFLHQFWPEKNRPEFVVKYPHHLLKIKQDFEDRYYFFMHGHFLEPLFRPINYLIEPSRLDELEGFNALWLESFNYHLGHASRLSEKVMEILTSYEQGYEKSKRKVKKILNEIFLNFQRKTRLGDIGSFFVKMAIKLALRSFPRQGVCALFQQPIDKKLLKEIKFYLEKYVFERYKAEYFQKLELPSPKKLPRPFTIVFGHTHRPNFAPQYLSQSKIEIDGEIFPVLNTGGWLRIDTQKGNGENAGILMIDSSGEKWYSLSEKLR